MSWKTLETRVVYDNPWITVREDRVISPAGSHHDYGHVHFKNKAVAILPLDGDGNTWLVGQHRFTLNSYSWELPMGGSGPGEDPLDTARRELAEETGLRAGRLSLLMKLHTSNSITDEEAFVYVAEELTEGETAFDETEVLQVRKLPVADAVAMVFDGKISDAISIAALLRVAHDAT